MCLVGQNTDGHRFVDEAAELGAAAVMVCHEEVEVDESVQAVVRVADTAAVLSRLAGVFFRSPSQRLAVVGITGTNGKTTTSYLIRSLYEAMGVSSGLLGTICYKCASPFSS